MDRFLAKCISDTTIKDLKVDEIYKVEYTTDFKIIYNETDKTFESVIIKYLLKYFPDDAELYYNLGIVYEKLKDFNQARKCYEKAVEISPQEDFYYNLGDVLVDLKEWDEAISAFRKVIE